MTKTSKASGPAKAAGLALAATGTLALSACATPFQAEVSRFERLPATTAGQSFFVTTEDPKLQGGIEFQTYADLVAAEMAQEGYVPAASPAAADLIVHLDYGVDDGQQRVVSDYDPFGYRGYGYAPYYGRYRYGWYDPWLYDRGGYNTRSYTFYTSGIDVQIDRAADGVRVFEGKAMARSRTNNLTYLVPNLVTAMFTGFPGNNGETVKITVDDEERGAR